MRFSVPAAVPRSMAIALGTLGLVLQKLGQPSEAAVALRQALAILEGMKSRETRTRRIPAGASNLGIPTEFSG